MSFTGFMKRFPRLEQILPVYAVIVMIIYPWTLMRFFWKLSSWLLFSTMGELVSMFAYMVVIDLIESLLLLLIPIVISIILPPKWFGDRFETRGTSMILFGLGFLAYLDLNIYGIDSFPLYLLPWIPVAAIAVPILVAIVDRIGFIQKFLYELSNRMVIFLYFSIPVSIFSLLIVLIRNVF